MQMAKSPFINTVFMATLMELTRKQIEDRKKREELQESDQESEKSDQESEENEQESDEERERDYGVDADIDDSWRMYQVFQELKKDDPEQFNKDMKGLLNWFIGSGGGLAYADETPQNGYRTSSEDEDELPPLSNTTNTSSTSSESFYDVD